MKKLIYLIVIFVAVSIFVAAPFAGASVEADGNPTDPVQPQEPIPADWPDEPGAMPALIDGKKADRPMVFIEPETPTESTESAAATTIDVWYGDTQNFGQNGNPQQWINILGNVSSTAGVSALSYTFQGSEKPLSMGPYRRLVNIGDFNIEIDKASLNSGPNVVTIKATDSNAQVTTKNVTINYTKDVVWQQDYTANWSPSPSPYGNVQSVAQVVDGKWGVNGDGKLVPQEVGYDRLVAMGDMGDPATKTWTDYQVTVPIKVNGLDDTGFDGVSNGPGVGIFLRWQGHTSKNGEQPGLDFERIGGIGWYRWTTREGEQGLELRGYDWRSGTNTSKVWDFDKTYIMKMSVQSLLDTSDTRAYYRLKFWPQGTTEPGTWDVEGYSSKGSSQSGSVVLVAHHVDAEFGDATIKPLSELSFTLTTSVTGDGAVTVNGLPNLPGKLYTYGEKVTLKATAGANQYLESWSGDLSVPGTIEKFDINMTKNMSITANFKEADPGTLTVNVEPAGAGTVTLNPAKDPVNPYAGGTRVTMTASPATGYIFSGWSGDLSGATNPGTILIDGNRTVKATFSKAGDASPISDEFNCGFSSPPWSFAAPNGGSQSVADGALQINVPAGLTMTLWDGDRDAPRVMQETTDHDFTVVIKYNSIPQVTNQMEGFLVEQDADNWIRFNIHFKNGLKMFAATTSNGSSTAQKPTVDIPSSQVVDALYLRISRVGNSWTQAYSVDGTTWQSPQTFEHALTVNKTGIFAANQNDVGSAPDFLASVDFFRNEAYPAGTGGFILDVSVVGEGAVELTPEPDDNGGYGCNQVVQLQAVPAADFTGWSGALTGKLNPTTITMNGNKSVTAYFGSAPPVTSGKIFLPAVTRP